MIKFYIQDSTIGKYVYFDTIQQLVKYLEGVVQRAYNLTRKKYTQNLEELGYGYDDDEGVNFTRSLQENFNIGIVTSDGKHIKTDVHHAVKFMGKNEYGSAPLIRFDERGKI